MDEITRGPFHQCARCGSQEGTLHTCASCEETICEIARGQCLQLAGAIAALFVGGLIYVLFRNDSLVMFTWFERLGLSSLIDSLRYAATGISTYLPRWVVFSLPNALWIFAGLSLFSIIWGHDPRNSRIIWFSAFWIVALGMETGQALHIVPGTFDWIDVAAVVVAGIFAHVGVVRSVIANAGGYIS
jgi:hypothetical protein